MATVIWAQVEPEMGAVNISKSATQLSPSPASRFVYTLNEL